MTRRANQADGSLLGVVVISMDPFYFTRFYRQIEANTRTLVALVGDDGIVRAQRIGNTESVAENIGQGSVFARIGRGPDTGTFDAATGLDGRSRLYAYRRIAGYPLAAVVGIDEEEALAPYYRARSHTMSWAIGATQFILLFSIVMALLVRRLEKSRELALAASEAKSDFLANMSHELRTPLHGILGYAELLDDADSDPVTRRYAGAIARSGKHLLDLVNDILDIGRIESGKSEVTPTEFDLVAFMGDIDSAHRSSASLKGSRCASRSRGRSRDR
jgi:signal transduction histidine kinase